MDQILKNTAGSIQVEFRDSTYALVDPNPQTPPVAITDGGGTAITSGTGIRVSQGVYSFALTPSVTQALDTYTATWTPTIAGLVNTFTTEFEVVGGFYFSITEARQYVNTGGDPGLDNAGITFQQIVDARALVEERFERESATSFVPRGARTVVDGDPWNPSRIVLRKPDTSSPISRIRKINQILLNGVAMSAGDIAAMNIYADEGAIQSVSASFFSFGYRNIQVWFEYGYDQCPLPVKRAALEYCRYLLLNNSEDERMINATSEMDTSGAINMKGPSRFRPTGLPSVDAVLWRYGDRLAGFA